MSGNATVKSGWKDIPRGGYILEAGNAEQYKTGDWRSRRPVWDEKRCIHCLRCWVFCPDGSILTEAGKMTGIDYTHCKGCGICVEECPDKVQALKMVPEGEAGEA